MSQKSPSTPGSPALLSHHPYFIRCATAADELGIAEMFQRSSAADLWLRCLGVNKNFPQQAAARLSRWSPDHEIVLVAIDMEACKAGEIVGIVHLVDEPGKPGSAEFDVMVRTDMHGGGLGFRLMQEIIAQARKRGLKKIDGCVSRENGAMLWMADELGFHRDRTTTDVVQISLTL